MNILRTNLILTILAILLSWIVAEASFAQYEFEKGDAVYRKWSPTWWAPDWLEAKGHAALYRDWNVSLSSTISDVHMNQHRIIEMQGDGMHTDHTVQDSLDSVPEGDFWGPAYLDNLSVAQRRHIITTALSFANAEYSFFSGYKNPNGDPPTFCCDGLVEYCYEQSLGDAWQPGNNGGIIPNDTYKTLSPIGQYNQLTHRTEANKPKIEVTIQRDLLIFYR